MISVSRSAWECREHKSRVMYYFGLVETLVFAILPVVYYKTVNSKPAKIMQMLDFVSANSILKELLFQRKKVTINSWEGRTNCRIAVSIVVRSMKKFIF